MLVLLLSGSVFPDKLHSSISGVNVGDVGYVIEHATGQLVILQQPRKPVQRCRTDEGNVGCFAFQFFKAFKSRRVLRLILQTYCLEAF